MSAYVVHCYNTTPVELNEATPPPQGLRETFESLKEAKDFAEKNINRFSTIRIKESPGVKVVKEYNNGVEV